MDSCFKLLLLPVKIMQRLTMQDVRSLTNRSPTLLCCNLGLKKVMFCSHLAPVWVLLGTRPHRKGKKALDVENGGGTRAAHGHQPCALRVPYLDLSSSPGCQDAPCPPLRGRRSHSSQARGRHRLPPANFPLPASCPASLFLRPGPATHGHKGRAAGQERRDAA